MGCILMELYSGELLFGTHENLEHLALMERILEPLPSAMLGAAPRSAKDKYVAATNRSGCWRLQWPEGAESSSSKQHVKSQRPLAEQTASQHHAPFTDFVGHLLTMDPARRPAASQAVRHPFFSKNFAD